METLLEIAGLNKWYGDLHVLKDINLTVGAAEVVVVIGPSGSGKSTLCRCINRLERFQSGTIRIDGVELPEEGKALARLRAEALGRAAAAGRHRPFPVHEAEGNPLRQTHLRARPGDDHRNPYVPSARDSNIGRLLVAVLAKIALR
ncbi:MAG: Glutamate uptake system ATP-binding protein [Acidimicrobiia bacterium]|nr:Glutamate uptake system ATP-binding protein [Acidimicrobiia bacterium]